MYGHIMASLLLLEHWHCVKSVQMQSVQIIHKSLNSVLIQENTDQNKKFRIWTLFILCEWILFFCLLHLLL